MSRLSVYNGKRKTCLRTMVLLMLCVAASMVGEECKAQLLSKGKASYYHDDLHGRKMSNGEVYHRDSLTCAHPNLPFGVMLNVRNMRNGKEVVVEVTDRGPFTKKYILDLSRAAASRLGILGRGYAPVEVSLYVPNVPPFRFEEEETVLPEPEWDYTIIDIYPDPVWQTNDWSSE